MLALHIEDESRHRFLVFIPRAVLEDWPSASNDVDLWNAFASNEIIFVRAQHASQFAPSHFCPSQEPYCLPPNFASPATNQDDILGLLRLLNAVGDV